MSKLSLAGIVNGTNPDLEWDGLPPPSIFQENKSEELTMSPSGNPDPDFLMQTMSSLPSSLSLAVCSCLHSRSTISPPDSSAGLAMKFGVKVGEASISLEYIDGKGYVVTRTIIGAQAADECYHAWESTKTPVEKATSSLKLIRESKASKAATFIATTNERNNKESTILKSSPLLPPPPPASTSNFCVSAFVHTMNAKLSLSYSANRGFTFTSDGKLLRRSPPFSSPSASTSTAPKSTSSLSTSGKDNSVSLTNMAPTVFRVKKSEAGTFVMHQSTASTSASQAPATPSISFGLTASSPTKASPLDHIECTFSKLSKTISS